MTLPISQIENIELENQKLRAANLVLKKKERYLEIINEFANSLLILETEEEIVWEIVKKAIARLNYLDCIIYLIDPFGKYLIQKAAHGPKNPIDFDILNPIKIKVGSGIVGTVAVTGIAEIIPDTSLDTRYISDEVNGASEIAVPIIDAENKVIGVIDSEHSSKGFFTEEDLKILKTIASIAATKLVQARTNAALKLSNQNLEHFAYTASHDLRQPIRTISNFAQLMQRSYADQLPQDGAELLHTIVKSARQMNQMINDLLEFSRIGRGRQQVDWVDCNQVLENVLLNLNATIETNRAKITADRLPKIKGVFSQLGQVFQNLINNAIKFLSLIHISEPTRPY